ncbi:MAG: lipopolysaccharide heptosyltransferase II [Candidatus Omnitrophota bacterium]
MPLKLPETPRILVTRTDRIGDLVLTTPLFRALREKFPKAWIAAVVFLEHREIVEGNPYLDEVILYDKTGNERGLLGQFLFSRKLRSKKFDVVIHAHGTNRMHLAAWLAGIPKRIGYGRRASWALTHVHPYNKKEGQKQEAEYLFDLLSFLDVKAPSRIAPFFPVTDRSVRSFENLRLFHKIPVDLPWIVLNLSASDVTKMWPVERFAELVTRMRKDHSCVFLAIGVSADRPLIQKLTQHTSVPVFDLSGRLSLGMLGALLKRSALLISNDSGPVHIANAVETPVVSIFGRYGAGLGPERWRPLGDRSRVVAKDVSHIPESERKFTYIDEIAVEDVLAAANDLLGSSGTHSCEGESPEKRRAEGGGRMEQTVSRHPPSAIPHPAKIRRILIVHPYGIGDLLFVTPVMRALRLIPTVETVDLLLGSRTREVVENNPHINDIFVADKDKAHRQTRLENFRDFWELGRKLRAKRYDLILDYSLRREHAFFGRFLLGIPKCAGFAYKKRATFHNIRFPLPEAFWKRHVVDFYCDLAEAAGIPVEDRFLEYCFPKTVSLIEAEVAGKLKLLPERFLAVAPGGGDSWGKEASFKRWPAKYFAELIKKLQEEKGIHGVAILGSRSERALCEEFQSMIKPPSVVLAGETSLSQTAMVLKKSVLFVGNDGGLVHLAHALHVPLIAFYGPVPPEVYGPYPSSPEAVAVFKQSLECRPCYYKFRYNKECKTIACLNDLNPEEAFEQIRGQTPFNEKRLS